MAELAQQLKTLRATRDALIDKRLDETQQIQIEYAGYKETKQIMEAQKKAKDDKAAAGMAGVWARKAPAGGATSSDGAAALAAAGTGKSVADKAAAELVARAMSIVLTDAAQLQDEARDAMEAEAAEQRVADFADF